MTSKPGTSTKAIHAGRLDPRPEGAITTPVFQTSTYEYHGEDYHDVGYLRLSNSPNHIVLADRIAALESTETALATGSGMAAISATLFALLSTGDHVLVQDCLYGGTTSLLNNELRRMGISHTPMDPQDPASWEALLQPTTQMVYVESLTNPLIQVADLEAVVEFAEEHGLVSVIDNTFASPVNFRPAEIGFDLSLHSGTKYLKGHSDMVCGAVIGRAEPVGHVKKMMSFLGGSLDAHACFLLHRGLKTLGVRVRQQNESAFALARFLETHPAVTRVNYPGLLSNSGHERAENLFDGFGGMLSFELAGGEEAARRFEEAVTIPIVAPSLGGVESLITRPAATSHAGLTQDERLEVGVSDGLIRASVGIEGTADLVGDFEAALASL